MLTTRNGCQPSQKGAADYFTGSVRINSRFQGSPPARVGGAIVTFEPGARTAWHTHPLGQTLIVTSGVGWNKSGRGLEGRDPPRGYRLVSARTKALAWRHRHDRYNSYRDRGSTRRGRVWTGWSRSARSSTGRIAGN